VRHGAIQYQINLSALICLAEMPIKVRDAAYKYTFNDPAWFIGGCANQLPCRIFVALNSVSAGLPMQQVEIDGRASYQSRELLR